MRDVFRKFACGVAEHVGMPWAFIASMVAVLLWALSGPLFHYSDTWQLTINTGTTIVTFLMVFLIQSTQNRDARTVHLKLDELIRAQAKARNLFADLEEATDEELRLLQAEFKILRQQGLRHEEAAAHASTSFRSRRQTSGPTASPSSPASGRGH